MRKKSKAFIILFVLVMLFVSACSNGEESDATGENNDTTTPSKEGNQREPIELVFASHLGKSQETFEEEIGKPIREQFPWITPTYIERGEGSNLEDLVVAGTPPDIVWFVHDHFPAVIQELGLDYDMTELVEKYDYDMSRFYQANIERLRYYTNGEGIYGIPMEMSTFVVYYNKDIFDKFGADYPTDGMTWDEMIDLARKMTRVSDDIQYRGLSTFHNIFIRENQLSLSPLDQNENKADVNNDGYKKLLNTLAAIYGIDGNNRPTDTRSVTPEVEMFEKEQNVAMTMLGYGRHNSFAEKAIGMDWDMVAMPSYPESPRTSTQSSPTFYSVTSTSKHKDAAFEVIQFLVNDERMIAKAKLGELVPVNTPEIRESFGQDVQLLEGKNIDALFYNEIAPPPPPRAPGLNNNVYKAANDVLNAAMLNMVIDGVDVNTALRNAEEEINLIIQNAMQ